MENSLSEGWQSGEEFGLPKGSLVFDGRENIHNVKMRVDVRYREEQEALAGIPWYERTSYKGTVPATIAGGISKCVHDVANFLRGK